MALAEYLIDKSVWARMTKLPVREVVEPLVTRGLVGTCGMVDAEMYFSARSVEDHERIRAHRPGLEWLATFDDCWERIAHVQRALTERGLHRSVPISDLLIAAVAERHEVTLLHYDADFDLIADVTGQLTRWVVPRGSVD
jgi:predicted nucleic acid-binding protein